MLLEKKKREWEDYVYRGILSPEVQPVVAKSWEKCRRLGVDPTGGIGKRIEDMVFQSIQKENQWLIDLALPIMKNLFDIVISSHFILVLTDNCGYILEMIGDEMINRQAHSLRFERGMLWNTEAVGSNAIGIALDQNIQIQMVGAEHYCTTHHGWTCAAAPIHGIDGELVGCLDISGMAEASHCHSLGIVAAAAFGIEMQIVQKHSADLMYTALNGVNDGIILLDQSFHSIWMNHSAEKILEIDLVTLSQMDFRRMLQELNWGDVEHWRQEKPTYLTDCRLRVGDRTVPCSANVAPILTDGRLTGYSVSFGRQEHLLRAVNKVSGNRATYTFNHIYANDEGMKQVVAMAQKYARYDGCILIEGESGTGKELFAQAIHNASRKAEGPFVAINCSSLPRDLVESELFGYEKGAFTGALKEGKPGKFELADGGTIFLDEIGEMPLEFQAKLLRIVQLHSVQRLGGTVEKPLDIRIIVATNRNLKEEVRQKNFREDLYFRFNVLRLYIPPLRERPGDIEYCARRFLNHFNEKYPDQKKEMEDSFLALLHRYPWPGNVRELQNFIERSFYTCSGSVLTAQSVSMEEIDLAEPKEKMAVQVESVQRALAQVEYDQVVVALRKCRGNAAESAALLGISRASLYRRTKHYGLRVSQFKNISEESQF